MTTTEVTYAKPTMGAEEFSDSLTGYDEIGIAKHFDLDIYADSETRPVVALRALVFTFMRRNGMEAGEAKDYAMKMSVGDAMKFFPDAEKAGADDDPAGNGEGP